MYVGPGNSQLDFGDDPDNDQDPGFEFTDRIDLHDNFTRGVSPGSRTNQLYFGDDPNYDLDPGYGYNY